MRTTTRFCLLASIVLAAGCTVKETAAPPMTGPSELALRLGLQVTPDSILRDGASQASISVEASGPDGRPARGVTLRVETSVDGVLQDLGTLSAKTIVTGEDGRARSVYTAPNRASESTDNITRVTFLVTPIGTDFRGEVSRTVDLRLVTPGVILPPNQAPLVDFSLTPTAPLPLQDVVFDASLSTDEGLSCGASCTYQWDFGDGTSATGIFVRHQFKSFGTYQVKLTVTDQRGASTTLARAVSVGSLVPPTASFTFSPNAAIEIGQTIFFNAETSRAAAGRRLVSYDWNFGSGRTGTGITTTKTYDNPGTYVVTLTVTDDAGEKGFTSQTVAVGSVTTNPGTSITPALTVTPTSSASAPRPVGTTFFFDASATRGPSQITEFRFNFGDGSPEVVRTAGQPTTTYVYQQPGVYNVIMTVRDVQGRTARSTATIYIQ